MTDLGPVPPCQADPKRGAHHGAIVVPSDNDGDLTWVCEACGAMRRVPVAGGLPSPSSLDDLSADAIGSLVNWEVR